MKNIIKSALSIGLGSAIMAKRATEKMIDRLVEQGKVSEKEGEKLIEEWKAEKDIKKDHWEKEYEQILEKVLRKMHIPTRADYELLEKRIDIIEKTLATTPRPNEPTL